MSAQTRDIIKTAYAHLYSFCRTRTANNGITVLLAHHVTDVDRLMQILSRLALIQPFLTPDQFEQIALGRKALAKPAWLMTFDDGYRSSAAAIREAESRLGIRSAFFVVPDWIGMRGDASRSFIREKLLLKDPPADEPVDWRELEALQERGHRIGSHSASHLRLSAIVDPVVLREQVADAKRRIAEKIGRAVDWFAYPFGDIGSISPQALVCIKENYKFCFSGIRGAMNDDSSPFAIARQSLALHGSRALVVAEALGAFDSRYRSARKSLEEMAAHV